MWKKKYDWQKKCWRCEEDEEVKTIWEYSKGKGEVTNENHIICCYCGSQVSEEDVHESTTLHCENEDCEKEFKVEVEYTPSFSTYPIEEE